MRSQPPKPLTESEIDRIMNTIPSSRDRLALVTHLSIVSGWDVGDDDPRLAAFTQADVNDAVRAAAEPLRSEILSLETKNKTQQTKIQVLLDRLSDLRDEIKELEAADAYRMAEALNHRAPVEAPVSNVVTNIVNWIRRTWTTDTVRAKMARQVADKIEAREYESGTPEPITETVATPVTPVTPVVEVAPTPSPDLPWGVVQPDSEPEFFRSREEARMFAREHGGKVRRANEITAQTEDEINLLAQKNGTWGVAANGKVLETFPSRSLARTHARVNGGKVVDLR